MAYNGKIIVNNEFFCLVGVTKTTKTSIRIVGAPAEIRIEYVRNKSEWLPLQLTCSVRLIDLLQLKVAFSIHLYALHCGMLLSCMLTLE
jgi:hypothetical protein